MKAAKISKSTEIPQTLNGPKKLKEQHLSSKFCIKNESVQGLDQNPFESWEVTYIHSYSCRNRNQADHKYLWWQLVVRTFTVRLFKRMLMRTTTTMTAANRKFFQN